MAHNIWHYTSFLCAYLSNRQQCVSINSLSNLVPVTSGVPQGSILGPLLFMVYINDSVTDFSSKLPDTHLYADDTKCSKEITSSVDSFLLQSDINAILNWSKTSQLLYYYMIPRLLLFASATTTTSTATVSTSLTTAGYKPTEALG